MNAIKLTERFINGIRDQGTRQELQTVVRLWQHSIIRIQNEDATLDRGHVDASIKKTMCTPTQSTGLDGLKTLAKKQQEMLEWQQEQIDRLTKKLYERLKDNQVINKRNEDQSIDMAVDLTEDEIEDREVLQVTEKGSATTVVECIMCL